MTKEEAVKLIDERMCFGRGKWSEHHMPEIDYYWKAGQMAIKALEQPEQKWIPCSERLPEEKQDVLLLMPHNMVVGFWEDVLNDGGRTWYANSGDGYFTDMDVLNGYDDPIAWMPLPEPYQGGGD